MSKKLTVVQQEAAQYVKDHWLKANFIAGYYSDSTDPRHVAICDIIEGRIVPEVNYQFVGPRTTLINEPPQQKELTVVEELCKFTNDHPFLTGLILPSVIRAVTRK